MRSRLPRKKAFIEGKTSTNSFAVWCHTRYWILWTLGLFLMLFSELLVNFNAFIVLNKPNGIEHITVLLLSGMLASSSLNEQGLHRVMAQWTGTTPSSFLWCLKESWYLLSLRYIFRFTFLLPHTIYVWFMDWLAHRRVMRPNFAGTVGETTKKAICVSYFP